MHTNGHVAKFQVGQLVEILTHRYHDVHPGTTGVIDCQFENGYGVEIAGVASVAGNDRGMQIWGVRVWWFGTPELRIKPVV